MEAKSSEVKIDLTELLRTELRSLCMNEEYADVVFIVEGERLPAHRVILAARSPYFRALLSAKWESKREVELTVPLLPFRALLFYLYSGQLSVPLGPKMCDAMLGVLELANEYLLTNLVTTIAETLCAYFSLDTVIELLNAAKTYNLPVLVQGYFDFVERNAREFVKIDSIINLPMDVLIETISRDTFCAAEIDILRMALRWNQHNNRHDPYGNLMPILSKIRFCHTSDFELREVTADPTMLTKLRTSFRESSPESPHRFIFRKNEEIPLSNPNSLPFRGNWPFVGLVERALINCVEVSVEPCGVSVKVELWGIEPVVLRGICNPTAKFCFDPLKVFSIRVEEEEARKIILRSVKAMYKTSE